MHTCSATKEVSFPIAADDHFLNVVRYVERNALRANLVERAQQWRFGSLWRRLHPNARPALAFDPWPVPQPAHWTRMVNQPLSEAELRAIRHAVVRGAPFGPESWQKQIARRLGLQYTLSARGRPRKAAEKAGLF